MLALSAVLLVVGAVTAWSLAVGPVGRLNGPPQSPWCLPDQTPKFSFGFAELAQHLGSIMGAPTECEHGQIATSNTLQETTTGLAVYDWCTNTPSFVRGQEHWTLTQDGVAYWSGSNNLLDAQPTVRQPDLRHPCPP